MELIKYGRVFCIKVKLFQIGTHPKLNWFYLNAITVYNFKAKALTCVKNNNNYLNAEKLSHLQYRGVKLL